MQPHTSAIGVETHLLPLGGDDLVGREGRAGQQRGASQRCAGAKQRAPANVQLANLGARLGADGHGGRAGRGAARTTSERCE